MQMSAELPIFHAVYQDGAYPPTQRLRFLRCEYGSTGLPPNALLVYCSHKTESILKSYVIFETFAFALKVYLQPGLQTIHPPGIEIVRDLRGNIIQHQSHVWIKIPVQAQRPVVGFSPFNKTAV